MRHFSSEKDAVLSKGADLASKEKMLSKEKHRLPYVIQ